MSKNEKHIRVNREIRIPEVRLIDPDGKQLGLFQTRDALRRAEDYGLDLVEISPQARPPVCKIMDVGKYKYEINKRQQEAKKHQTVVHIKEIKFRPTTDTHDVETKLKHIRAFLEDGDKVKLTIKYRGREMAHKELGYNLLNSVIDSLKEVAAIEQSPKMEGKALSAMIGPVKG